MSRSRELFDRYLNRTREKLALVCRALETGDYSAVEALDAECDQLWRACLADGWTQEDGMRALRKEA